jgi:hypothetical protein
MGVLESTKDGRRFTLGTRCLVGRSPLAQLRLGIDAASAEHATVWWDEAGWHVRDLGSTNGTWVEDRRLRAGEATALGEGVRLAFGAPEASWVLAGAGPPVPAVRHQETGRAAGPVDGVLFLPDADAPLGCVVPGRGAWWLERVAGAAVVVDQDVVDVDGAAWTLELPPGQYGSGSVDPAAAGVCLDVGPGDTLVVEGRGAGPRRVVLPPGPDLAPLVALVRQRLGDARRRGAPEAQGWLSLATLADALSLAPLEALRRLWRTRSRLRQAGWPEADCLLQWQEGTDRIRVGLPLASPGC